jgi:predicted metalloendopeptidase
MVAAEIRPAQMVSLVETLREAYRTRIVQADWMAPATRQAALRKLAKLRVKIGESHRR